MCRKADYKQYQEQDQNWKQAGEVIQDEQREIQFKSA